MAESPREPIPNSRGRSRIWIFVSSKRWVLASFAALVVFFAAIFHFEGDPTLERTFSGVTSARNFDGSLLFSALTYDRQTKSGVARAELNVKANSPDLDVKSVAFSYEESADHSRYFQYCHLSDTCLTGFEDVPGPTGKPQTNVKIQFDPIRLRASEYIPEVFYPFDKPSFKLSFMACVNDSAEKCAPANLLLFKTIEIQLADTDFVLDADRTHFSAENAVFSLHRKLFIRGISLLFLGISLIFFGYLLRLSKPDDLMTKSLGFFGTLWGLRALLVPSTVKVFPTAVDYAILGAFCFLFVLIVLGVRAVPPHAGG